MDFMDCPKLPQLSPACPKLGQLGLAGAGWGSHKTPSKIRKTCKNHYYWTKYGLYGLPQAAPTIPSQPQVGAAWGWLGQFGAAINPF